MPHKTPPTWMHDPDLDEDSGLTLLLQELEGSGWTLVGREVLGTHASGKRLRVDAVLRPPEAEQWATKLWALEAKPPVLPADSTDHAALVVQAADYRHVKWDDYGPLPTMIWPEPFAGFLGEQAVGAVRAILGRMRVPPLRWVSGHGLWLGLTLTRVWSQARGRTSHAERWDLTPRRGAQ